MLYGGDYCCDAGTGGLGDTWWWDGQTWSRDQNVVTPYAQTYYAMVHDSLRQRIVLQSSRRIQPPVWLEWFTFERVGTTWIQHFPSNQPTALEAYGMGVLSGVSVLFGGRGDYSFVLDETWLWDGSDWALANPTRRPSGRWHPAMATDTDRGCVVLFGGDYVSSGIQNDTWEWDGSDWSRQFPANSPPPMSAVMAYDSIRRRTVLIGWTGSNPVDTWEYDGVDWLQRTPQTRPQVSSTSYERPVATFDAARGRVIFVDPSENSPSTTWEWDGTDWLARSTMQFPQLADRALAYDPSRQVSVLVGRPRWAVSRPHSACIWEYGVSQPGAYSEVGPGCPGSVPALGVPVLQPASTLLPWIGSTYSLRLDKTLPGTPTSAFLGRQQPVPLDLTSIGMPGCQLFCDIHAVGSFSAGTWTLPIPALPSLVGGSFCVQAAAVDRPANPLGVVLSNAGEVFLGAR